MSKQPLFMYYRAREEEQQHEIKTAFNLEFNDDNFAIATPQFWTAWRAEKKVEGNRSIRHQYALGKYPADQLGLQGQKPVWVVFISRAAKETFEAKHAPVEASNADGELKGLGWHATRGNAGMFLDERNKTYRSRRSPVVAWLNYNRGRYSVNVVSQAFQLTRSIPTSITKLGEAVDWVYQYSQWRN